ncbi:MAG: CvpA family protein [Verrucomicrobiota bacterium]
MKNLPFNYIDIIIVVLLIVGIFRGRKRGMSEELLSFIQWMIIIFVGCRIYQPLGNLIKQHAPFSLLTCYVMVYVIFAILVKLIFSQIKHAVGEKLIGSNFFGGSEYYFGMFAGMIRFACVVLMVMALLNARLITDKERAETARMQTKNFEGISFPTFGSIQQSVLFESCSGQQVKKYLNFVLIESTAGENVPLRRDENKALDEVIGPAKK